MNMDFWSIYYNSSNNEFLVFPTFQHFRFSTIQIAISDCNCIFAFKVPSVVPLNNLFQVVSQQTYLEINDDFELVTTENRIDRERICPNLFKAGEECTMDASIYTFNARSRKSETYTIR